MIDAVLKRVGPVLESAGFAQVADQRDPQGRTVAYERAAPGHPDRVTLHAFRDWRGRRRLDVGASCEAVQRPVEVRRLDPAFTGEPAWFFTSDAQWEAEADDVARVVRTALLAWFAAPRAVEPPPNAPPAAADATRALLAAQYEAQADAAAAAGRTALAEQLRQAAARLRG